MKSSPSSSSPLSPFIHQWRDLEMSREQYSLRYESRYLEVLGNAIDYFATIAMTVAAQEAIKASILGGTVSYILHSYGN